MVFYVNLLFQYKNDAKQQLSHFVNSHEIRTSKFQFILG